MKNAVVFRHVSFEDLGTLDAVLERHGYRLSYLDATLDDLSASVVQEPDLLVVLGGPIGVYDEESYPFLTEERNAIRRRLEKGLPLLGICLGAQLIASVLGAEVKPMGVKEIGFSPVALTAAGRESVLAALNDVPVLHWHGDQFEVPVGGVRLAETSVCPNQAFSVGKHVLGLQFHLEVDARRIEQWLVGHACELDKASINPCNLRVDAGALGERLATAARSVLEEWLRRQVD